MNNKPKLIDSGTNLQRAGLVHRVWQPQTVGQLDTGGPSPTVIMLHGHLGNEDVMWVFAQTLPPGWLVVAPRAIVPTGENGFSWQARAENEWPGLAQFAEAVRAVSHFIQALPALYNADLNQLYVMGFSQGAAVAFATAIAQPGLFKGIASLVGFTPLRMDKAIERASLRDVPVFMAAGMKDERIPLPVAQASAETVRAMGAYLEYREYDTGHKLNIEGMRKLKSWWAEREQFRLTS